MTQFYGPGITCPKDVGISELSFVIGFDFSYCGQQEILSSLPPNITTLQYGLSEPLSEDFFTRLRNKSSQVRAICVPDLRFDETRWLDFMTLAKQCEFLSLSEMGTEQLKDIKNLASVKYLGFYTSDNVITGGQFSRELRALEVIFLQDQKNKVNFLLDPPLF